MLMVTVPSLDLELSSLDDILALTFLFLTVAKQQDKRVSKKEEKKKEEEIFFGRGRDERFL